MPTILITGSAGTGKTSLAYALLARAREAGLSAAYVKPFSPAPDADPDHSFASEVLAGALDVAVGSRPHSLDAISDTASSAISELSRQNDAVVVELADGASAPSLADSIDARVVEVMSYRQGRDWANAVDEATGRWGNRLAGVVVNAVPPYRRDEVASGAARSEAVIEIMVIPESRPMVAPTVAQIGQRLGATWPLDPVNEDALVERYLIGGNIMDSGPAYYGRYENQAVITRAQRPDIQLASMLPQTCCLVLTGPGEPTEYIKAEARERDIPLLQVSSSTIDTADALEQLLAAATPHNLVKVRHFACLLEQHAGTDWLAGILR